MKWSSHEMADARRQFEERFITWARSEPHIRGALMIGSRARTHLPADRYSDLDIVIASTRPDRYLDSTDWLNNLGAPWVTFVEETGTGSGRERRVLFAGELGFDVDFAIFPVWRSRFLLGALLSRRLGPLTRLLPRLVQGPIDEIVDEFLSVTRRGYRILVDKDRLLTRVMAVADRLPLSVSPTPTQAQLTELSSDFWYHALWAAKKLARGEIFMAGQCCDVRMKYQILQVMEWQARARPGSPADTWHSGRFLERWADQAALRALESCFAHYDAPDVARALHATMDLFHELATDVAHGLDCRYPQQVEDRVRPLVDAVIEEVEIEPGSPT
jgi:aminoglycoside 6-adenylyltransferase